MSIQNKSSETQLQVFTDESPNPAWLRLSAEYTAFVDSICERDDIRVRVAPVSSGWAAAAAKVDQIKELSDALNALSEETRAEAASDETSSYAEFVTATTTKIRELQSEIAPWVPRWRAAGGPNPTGCLKVATGYIEINGGKLLAEGLDPANLSPSRPGDRELMAGLHGVLVHESGHASHTLWFPKMEELRLPVDEPAEGEEPKAPKHITARHQMWMAVFEESRMEGRVVSERPNQRRWLRAAFNQTFRDAEAELVEVSGDPITQAAHTAALTMARVDAGVLEEEDTGKIEEICRKMFGEEPYKELREAWLDAQDCADDDAEGLLAAAIRGINAIKQAKEDAGMPEPGEGEPGDGEGGEGESSSGEGSPGGSSAGKGEPGEGESEGTPSGSSAGDGSDELGEATKELMAALSEALEEAVNELVEEMAAGGGAGEVVKIDKDAVAEREKEAAAHTATVDTAEKVFAPESGIKGGHGYGSGGDRLNMRQRPPTAQEKAYAGRLAKAMSAARFRDRLAVNINTDVPPGHLKTRVAMVGDALDSAGLQNHTKPWRRTKRTHTEMPPLRVGVMTDVSGSMGSVTAMTSSLTWMFARAVNRSGGKFASVLFGTKTHPLTMPGKAPAMVTDFDAHAGSEDFCTGVDALTGALDLDRDGFGARLLVVISDGHYVRSGEMKNGLVRVQRLLRSGCYILQVNQIDGYDTTEVMEGIVPILVTSAVDAIPKIADAVLGKTKAA